ncbi:serine/arginine-rich SC35-like splicing factor SCL28 [Cornus florida]|uniref:serine/arginine-rich SC35-like splicing factor SCL28 n=1 Tax=Cornus florida TaxID=4283 RepID=UPI00289AAFAF|nr:serine/arginine-rich SC35-like splicing factor SCL28 [Cornus florida]
MAQFILMPESKKRAWQIRRRNYVISIIAKLPLSYKGYHYHSAHEPSAEGLLGLGFIWSQGFQFPLEIKVERDREREERGVGMGRYRSRSRSYSPRRGRSPPRRKQYDEPPRDTRSRRDRRSPAPSGLLVRNISLDARPEDLRNPFERFGPIKDVYLPKDYYTGEPRGFGFVKFRYPEDAAEAKEQLNYTVIGGREIRIVFAEENRKTPHEMRRHARTSDQGSYRRRTPLRSPRRRYHSSSRTPSPARSELRERRSRDDYYSPRHSRSYSRSISPQDERNYKLNQRSPRRSRSVSRSLSPRDERSYRSNYRSPSPGENGRSQHDKRDYEPNRSQSQGVNTLLRSRSYSPR